MGVVKKASSWAVLNFRQGRSFWRSLNRPHTLLSKLQSVHIWAKPT